MVVYMSNAAENKGAISDSELVRRLQAGNLEALGILYDHHRGLVFRTALAITGDAEAAADSPVVAVPAQLGRRP